MSELHCSVFRHVCVLCIVQFWQAASTGLVLGLIQPGYWQHFLVIFEFFYEFESILV